MAKHWSNIQESGALLGMRVLFFAYRHIGKWVFALCLHPVIIYYFLRNSAAREASLDYLRRVQTLGAIPANSSLLLWSLRHFFEFGKTLGDKLIAWTGAFQPEDVEFYQRDDFLQLVGQRKGALVIVSHLGNQEVCRALANAGGKVTLNVLVHTKHAEKFNQLMNQVDNDNHLNLIQVSEITPATAIMLQTKIAAGEVVVIAGDRTPVSGSRTSDAEFLGSVAEFPQGPYIIASVLRCPVYLLFCVKSAGVYQLFFEHFADSIQLSRKNRTTELQQWAQKFANRLAYYTLKAPLQWNNFYLFWQRSQPASPTIEQPKQ